VLLVGAVAEDVSLALHDVTHAVAVEAGVACAAEDNTVLGAIASIAGATLKASAISSHTLTSSWTAVRSSLPTRASPLSWAPQTATESSPPLR